MRLGKDGPRSHSPQADNWTSRLLSAKRFYVRHADRGLFRVFVDSLCAVRAQLPRVLHPALCLQVCQLREWSGGALLLRKLRGLLPLGRE